MRLDSVLVLGLLTGVLAVPARTQDVPEARMPEGTALVIDGTEISVPLYLGWLVRFRGEAKAVDYVEFFLLEREAARLEVTVPSEFVQAEVRARLDLRIQAVFGEDRDAWVAEIEKEHRSVQGLERELSISVRSELTAAAILGEERVVTDEMLRLDWEHKYGRGGHTIDARVIGIELDVPPAPPGATLGQMQAQRQAAIERGESDALALRRRIEEGESFALLARQYSEHPTARDGGAFEGGFRPGQFSAEVLDELEKVSPGEVSSPIFGMGAWWIFAVDDVRRTPFESVRADLEREFLTRQPTPDEFRALRHRLLSASQWEVLPAMWAEPENSETMLAADEPVLLIDESPVRRAEYARWLLHYHGELIAPRFVEAWVVNREAVERGFTISMDDVRRRVEIDIQRTYEEAGFTSLEDWEESLATALRASDSIRRDMYVTHPTLYLAEDMIAADRVVTEEMIVARWETEYGKNGSSLDALVIELEAGPVRTRDASSEERERMRKIQEEKRALADKIQERLKNGEDFGALAQRYSDDPETRSRGGEFAKGFSSANWPEDVIQNLSGLEPGQVSETIDVDGSLFIFQLREYRHTPLESVRKAIEKELREQRPTTPELASFRNLLVRDVPYRIEVGMSSL